MAGFVLRLGLTKRWILLLLLCQISLIHSQYFSGLVKDKQILTLASSPYVIDDDIIISESGSLTIEPGVHLKFRPGTGIIVRGSIIAKGNPEARIVFDSTGVAPEVLSSKLRLIDGPNPLSGRLQIYHLGQWRSVCTNSRNWTVVDYQVACRQMGYTGGRFWQWMDRVNSSSSRPLLFEKPNCHPETPSVLQCDWSSRRVGSGVCDYHGDLGMECRPYFDPSSGIVGTRWRGVRFENARYRRELIQGNSLYVKVSESHLQYVDILNAGVGFQGDVHSALETIGVVPQMDKISVERSVYNGINITQPGSIVVIRGATVINNQGYGVYVNSSTGAVLLDSCTVSNNTHEGVKYVFHDKIPDEAGDNVVKTFDFCMSAITSTQVYPLPIIAESNGESVGQVRCEKQFKANYGHVLTLQFVNLSAIEDDAAEIEIHDGPDSRSPLIARFSIRNGTRPQSVTTTRDRIWIQYTVKPLIRTLLHMELTSGYSKSYDLNVTRSIIANNGGRGVLAENMRSLVHLQGSTLQENYWAGLHVVDGSGDVNVTGCYVGRNYGDGINVTYSGGRMNVSYSVIEANTGHGLVTWYNHTSLKLALNQEIIVAYSTVSLNLWTGVLVGNFCSARAVNISSNYFNESQWDAVEIQSCWKPSPISNVFVGHNRFVNNNRIGLVISPAVSMNALIEHNFFRQHSRGCLKVRNPDALELEILQSEILITNNRFESNSGSFVVNLGLSQYGELQKLLFTRNWIKRNIIREAFPSLHPRSRISAVVVIGSSNVNVTRNMIENPESHYELGSQLEDHSRQISCVRNWLGRREEKDVYYRIFDRKDRYNLAQISFKPFLLHDTDYDSDSESTNQNFVPSFIQPGSREIGGEITGQEELIIPGVYHVTRDITIHPSGRLTVAFGVTLRFEHTLGMMVGGELIAEGSHSSSDGGVAFTLMERMRENMTDISVRLVGGKSPLEGRLQVKIKDRWGTVCNYGWDIQSAALACQQMGMVLNPNHWYLEPHEIAPVGLDDPVLLNNVQCTDLDTDVRFCRSEGADQAENYCGHDQDVGLRCYDVSWAGLRFGMTAKKSTLRSVSIEKAGLFDYSTYSFQPALRIDFHHHVLDRLKITHNSHDGLGIIYSDLYYPERVTNLKNSEISQNLGNGISLRTLGMQVTECRIEDNAHAGIHYNPILLRQELREMIGWLSILKADNFIPIPDTTGTIELFYDQPKYLKTMRIKDRTVKSSLIITTDQRNVIGMQLINPVQNSSTEEILIRDYGILSNEVWNVRINTTSFPTVSSSYRITVDFTSGLDAKGGVLLLLTAVRRSDIQVQRSRLLPGPLPTLTVSSTTIRRNQKGISTLHYNRYMSFEEHHYLRKSNETIQVLGCELSQNREEAILVRTPYRDVGRYPLAEIKYMINFTTITDNGRAILQFSRDLRDSNNLFHWILQNDTIYNNRYGGFDVKLPYVWQYNENYTHTVFISNTHFHNNRNFAFSIDGHFARVNITDTLFENNDCKSGLMALRGMEKECYILRNSMWKNTGDFMVEFNIDSQSEILGEVQAYFTRNIIKDNIHHTRILHNDPHLIASYSLALKGVQKVNITENRFGNNAMDYEFLAGIRTAKLDNYVNVQRNYWGTPEVNDIREKIFDFDDWNSYAIARFRPYLLEDMFDGPLSSLTDTPTDMDIERLGGRLNHDLVLLPRSKPYVVHTDLTVMPGVKLTILPNVVLEFFPSVGILVLGTLQAQGHWDEPIIMRPVSKNAAVRYRVIRELGQETVRLCLEGECPYGARRGYLELYNSTTSQWVPICDKRFAEHNARVVCRQLGLETMNEYYSFGRRWEFQPTTLSRIRYWPEPLQCIGTESKLEDCDIRMNGQVYNHVYTCPWDEDFVFVECGERNLPKSSEYWGGIRFSVSVFEENVIDHHRPLSSRTGQIRENQSFMDYVQIFGAGILHGQKSPAVLATLKSPFIQQVNISHCASDGISLISPAVNMPLLDNRIFNNLGIGINVLMLNGETRDADLSAFSPLRIAPIPYNVFGILDACDPAKQVLVEERILVYYRYDNRPADCVKIFTSFYGVKTFGFRLLQLNLVNSTGEPWEPDSIKLYDGDIYNITSTLLAEISATTTGPAMENRLYRSKKPSLSLKIHSSGADSLHGFIAEIITLPIAAIGFNRDVQHNISFSVFDNNQMGAVRYSSAGEINPILTMEWNRFVNNGKHLYGNFTTSEGAVVLDVQNMETMIFRNNLVRWNQGGLKIQADSSGAPTSLKAFVHTNVFADNNNQETLFFKGRKSSPYQEVTLLRNYVSRSSVRYREVILLDQIVANFTFNYIFNNLGYHIMGVHGFEPVRQPIYQVFEHNSFHKNFATDRDNRGTVIAGNSGQRYTQNVFVNPDNDYEMIALNWTGNASWEASLEMQRTPIDAMRNWWGYNESTAVVGRIRDFRDVPELLEIRYDPFYRDNRTVLSGKCDPGWTLVGDTCYLYIGVAMNFTEAKEFCKKDNASLPYLMNNFYGVTEFLRSQQRGYDLYTKVWVQHLDMIGQCVVFMNRRVERSPCDLPLPFLCEADPRVVLNPLGWTDDGLTVGLLGTSGAALLLVALCTAFWVSKSRHRATQRLERRNSIRASIRSSRSLNSLASSSGFLDTGVRRKPLVPSKTDRFNGSVDSIEKSQLNSSVEDNRSFDIYEAHNPNGQFSYAELNSRVPRLPNQSQAKTSQTNYELTFENQGYRDNSTFNSQNPSRTPSEYWDSSSLGQQSTNTASVSVHPNGAVSYQPQMNQPCDTDYGRMRSRSDGLGLDNYSTASVVTDSTLAMKRELDDSDAASAITLPQQPPTSNHRHPGIINRPPSSARSQQLLETNFDLVEAPRHAITTPYLASSNENFFSGIRSKSTPLETDM